MNHEIRWNQNHASRCAFIWASFVRSGRKQVAIVEIGEEKSLQRLDAQTFGPLEVAAIVGQKREVMSERCRTDEKIAIADHQASGTQPATFFAEDLAGALVQTSTSAPQRRLTARQLAKRRRHLCSDVVGLFLALHIPTVSPSTVPLSTWTKVQPQFMRLENQSCILFQTVGESLRPQHTAVGTIHTPKTVTSNTL